MLDSLNLLSTFYMYKKGIYEHFFKVIFLVIQECRFVIWVDTSSSLTNYSGSRLIRPKKSDVKCISRHAKYLKVCPLLQFDETESWVRLLQKKPYLQMCPASLEILTDLHEDIIIWIFPDATKRTTQHGLAKSYVPENQAQLSGLPNY